MPQKRRVFISHISLPQGNHGTFMVIFPSLWQSMVHAHAHGSSQHNTI